MAAGRIHDAAAVQLSSRLPADNRLAILTKINLEY